MEDKKLTEELEKEELENVTGGASVMFISGAGVPMGYPKRPDILKNETKPTSTPLSETDTDYTGSKQYK